MPIIDKSVDATQKCRCGRPLSVIHCTDCGSTNVRALKNREPNPILTPDTKKNRKWHCQRCGWYFFDVDRLTCEAPTAPQFSREHGDANVYGVGKRVRTAEERAALVADAFKKSMDRTEQKREAQGPNDEVGLAPEDTK